MKYFKTLLSVFLVLFVSTQIFADNNDEKELEYESILKDAIDLFAEYVLPNSMARLESFDINEHLKQIDKERKTITTVFHNDEGIKFLIKRLDNENDEISIIAIINIIYESKNPMGLPILKEYCEHGNEVVSRFACKYLNE